LKGAQWMLTELEMLADFSTNPLLNSQNTHAYTHTHTHTQERERERHYFELAVFQVYKYKSTTV
jgi:hypothetical protein